MHISTVSSLTFSVLLIACTVVLLIASRRMHQTPRRFFGTGSLPKVAIETLLIILAIACPLFFIDSLILLQVGSSTLVNTLIPNIISLFLALSSTFYPSLVPLWMAIRLAPPPLSESQSLSLPSFKIIVFLFLVVFLALSISYGLGPIPILMFQERFSGQLFDPGALTQALVLTLWSIFLFIAARVLISLVGNPPELSKDSELKDMIATTERDETKFYDFLIGGLVLALLVLLNSLAVYGLGLENALYPVQLDLYEELGLPINPPLPLERAPPVSFIIMASSLVMLLTSLFIAVYIRPSELAAKLFVLLGFLYGMAAIDAFPFEYGVFFFGLTVFAKVYIIPVQMHFAMVFPRHSLKFNQTESKGLQRNPFFLYIVFIPLAILLLILYLNQAEFFSLLQQLNDWIQRRQPPSPEFTRLFVQVAFSGIVSALFLFASVFGWTFSIVLLRRNYRNIRQQKSLLLSTLEDQESPIKAEMFAMRERLSVAVQQFKWVFWGASIAVMGVASVFFLFIPFPIFSEGGWSDAILRLTLLAIFAFTTFAMIKYRLWDVDRLLRRTLIFTTLLISFNLILEILFELLINRFFQSINQFSPELFHFLTTFLAAVLAYSVEGPVEAFVDRRFLQGMLASFRKMEELKRLIKEAPTVEKLKYILTEVVPDRFGYSQAWAIISSDLHIPDITSALRQRGATIFFPLEYEGKTLGIYGLASKISSQKSNDTEQNLLTDLSKTAARQLNTLQASESTLIRVLLISNKQDAALAELLAEQLNDEFEITEIITSQAAIKTGTIGQADVALLIIGASRRIQVTPSLRSLREHLPEIRVLILVDKLNQTLIEQAKRVGANGCSEKTSMEEIRQAIPAIYQGKTWFFQDNDLMALGD